jgi:GNAT superfamily N-acetyltransferase
MMRTDVTTWSLEMTAPEQLRPARPPRLGVTVERAEVCVPAFSRFLYSAVGGDHYWLDRLGWSAAQWTAWLDRPEVETWVARVRGTPAGYVELEEQPGDDVEVAYFGLLPQFRGQGLGGHLLTVGVRRAWERGARRVWVHTCSLDGPHALANYTARGFTLFSEVTATELLPDESPGPWPGWRG